MSKPTRTFGSDCFGSLASTRSKILGLNLAAQPAAFTIEVSRTGGTSKTPLGAAIRAAEIPQKQPRATPKNGTTTAVYQSTRGHGSGVRQLAAAFPARRDQLAGRAQERGTRSGEARASSQEKSGSKLPHSRPPRTQMRYAHEEQPSQHNKKMKAGRTCFRRSVAWWQFIVFGQGARSRCWEFYMHPQPANHFSFQ